MSSGMIDILMITYNRAEYTRLSLSRLLDTCDDSCRVWIWQNGNDPETLQTVSEWRDHPRVYRYHHSAENRKLRDPSNWLLSESDGDYVSKVDDDCLVPDGWLETLREAHIREPRLGAVACWHFLPEDYLSEVAAKKILKMSDGLRVMCHPWVGGSGFLLKRACVDRVGLISKRESGITGYFLRIARAGWTNGWLFPFLYQEHMDDPRAPHTMIRSDDDLRRHLPLSAKNFGSDSLSKWEAQLRRSAVRIQAMPSEVEYYNPIRQAVRKRLQRLFPAFDDPAHKYIQALKSQS